MMGLPVNYNNRLSARGSIGYLRGLEITRLETYHGETLKSVLINDGFSSIGPLLRIDSQYQHIDQSN